ncbi:MAG: ROK family protein [Acidobacteriaceae bacterium]|nr:ROK family protein [Acidobacteriaceae bacterium]MBV9780609.1 ROK family protein [Acidobacteriaceae bacterium]
MAHRAEAESVLCVDIGGTSTKAGLVNSTGELSGLQSIPTGGPNPERFGNELSALIERVHQAACAQETACIGLGVAVAGFLNPERTTMIYNSNLPWLENYPLRDYLAKHFPMRVEIEVDSNAACMAEYCFGSGRGSDRFLCIAAGTGLGVGMAIKGVPLRFAYECLGDIGHVILERNGPLCTCGGRGCAEILVSAPALAQQYRERTRAVPNVSLRDVISAAENSDEIAISVLSNAGEWLGLAAASMANIFFPDRIAIAGGLSAAGDLILKPAKGSFQSSASLFAQARASLCRAELGPMATLAGAAWPFLAHRPIS